jgi:hypothetical protein
MPAATAFVEFMDSEGSRLIEAQVGKPEPAPARQAAAKSGQA